MKVSLNYVIFMNFKPNKILRITSNTTLIQYPNTNFTKFAKNWIIQIKFYQILNKYLFYKSKYYQIHLRTPKYWDFESFFSICEYQMLSLARGDFSHLNFQLQKEDWEPSGRQNQGKMMEIWKILYIHLIRDPKGITYVRFILKIESDAKMRLANTWCKDWAGCTINSFLLN